MESRIRLCRCWSTVSILSAILLCACTAPAAVLPAPAGNMGSVSDQLARGAPLYAQNCATADCHGLQGEGIRQGSSFRAWPLVGHDFQARNPNAQVVFDVVRSGGELNLRAMTDQQLYDAIAYELSLNGVQLSDPLTAVNAAIIASGSAAKQTDPGIFPPLSGAEKLESRTGRHTSLSAANDEIGLRVDQMALADAVPGASPPEGGTFLIVVLALQDMTDHTLDIGPEFLRLEDSQGNRHEPQSTSLGSAIEAMHDLTIRPEHGNASIVVFALPQGADYRRLVYDDHTGHALSLSLVP